MRDPFEFIQFFKSEVYHSIEEDYLDVLEDIKILKENHVLIKENFRTPSSFFKKITTKLSQSLEHRSPEVQEKFDQLVESQRVETLENFTETLIYERIGSHLLKSLVQLYVDDEIKFRQKCLKLWQMHDDPKDGKETFNSVFGCDFPQNLQPRKSA